MEKRVGEKSIFVQKPESPEINQRDFLISESSGESISPNIN